MAQEIKQSKCAEYITVDQQKHKHFISLPCLPSSIVKPTKRSTCYWGYFDLSRGINHTFSREKAPLTWPLPRYDIVERCKSGAAVRALDSHQFGLGSNPSVDAICGLSLLLVLSFAPRGFFSGFSSGFLLSLKTNTSKFQFDLERTDTFQRVLMNSQLFRG